MSNKDVFVVEGLQNGSWVTIDASDSLFDAQDILDLIYEHTDTNKLMLINYGTKDARLINPSRFDMFKIIHAYNPLSR
jgi:hypothetical protein